MCSGLVILHCMFGRGTRAVLNEAMYTHASYLAAVSSIVCADLRYTLAMITLYPNRKRTCTVLCMHLVGGFWRGAVPGTPAFVGATASDAWQRCISTRRFSWPGIACGLVGAWLKWLRARVG